MEKTRRETKVISWNVNGLKARMDSVKALVEVEHPDILCLQEIKVKNPSPYLDALPGYAGSVNTNKEKNGHAGVAI